MGGHIGSFGKKSTWYEGVDHDLRGVDQTSRWKSPGVVFLNANKNWNEIKKDTRMVVTNSFASEFIANSERYFVQKLSYCSENIIKLKWRIPARSDLQRPWQNLESSKKVMVNQASKKFQFCCSRYLKKVLFFRDISASQNRNGWGAWF